MFNKNFQATNFPERRFMEPHASQEKDQVPGMQWYLPAAGLNGEDKLVLCLGADGTLVYNEFWGRDISCIEGTYIWYR